MKNSVEKKEIEKALNSLNRTEIFKIAKKAGVNLDNRSEIFNFIQKNAPEKSQSHKRAFEIAYQGNNEKIAKYINLPDKDSRILIAINMAKFQKKEGFSNYSKVLIEGNQNIYWASPSHGHSDYNKSIAFPKSEKTLKVSKIINAYLGF